jgi:DNA-directed RNA polymerase subunit omega
MADRSNIVDFPGLPDRDQRPVIRGNRSTNMRSDLVEQASKVIPEPPTLINMVSRRVKQLNLGRPPLIEIEGRMGNADIALKEIIEGKIVVEEAEEI